MKPILITLVVAAALAFLALVAVACGPAEGRLVEAQATPAQQTGDTDLGVGLCPPQECPPPPQERIVTLWGVRYRVKWVGVGTGGAYDCPHYRPYLVPEVD